MSKQIIKVEENILSDNSKLAEKLKERFDELGVLVLNVMASPGAGKTSLIMKIIESLGNEYRIGVVDGDVVEVDVKRMRKLGIPVVLANTGGACHLDALMVKKAVEKLDLKKLNVLVIENVGNLICPMNFPIGANINLVVGSVPEGDDKPYKYPGMFKGADVLVLNKIDYLTVEDFDMEYYRNGVERLNPGLKFFPLSCKNGEGIDDFIKWMKDRV